MRKAKILDKAETLSHDQRWKYMIELGRNAQNDQTLANILDELSCSEVHYEKLLALMSAHGSFSREIIGRLLQDPSSAGMGAAVQLAAKHLPEDELVDLILGLSKSKRQRIAMALLAIKRTTVIDRVYEKLSVYDQQEMLFYTSEHFFFTHLDRDGMEGLTEKQWRQMARRFPSFADEQIRGILVNSTEPSWLTRQATGAVLQQFYQTAPTRGLSLLTHAITYLDPRNLSLKKYALLFPTAVVELMLNYPAHLAVSLPVIVLKKLNNEALCSLGERNMLVHLPQVFPQLHPAQRIALYQYLGESLRDANGALPLTYVKALPEQVREKEALHAFQLKLLEAKPTERIPYLAMLSFDQASALAAPFLNQPEGELRALAISALVHCGRYHSSALDLILDLCLKRENEQDPVRLAMMTALADLPSARWTETHLPKIKSIIAAALQARDCSIQTMAVATTLLLKMLTLQTDFVCAELPVLAEKMGMLNMHSLASGISHADIVKLDAHLLPLMKTWVARDRSHFAVFFIVSFGHRFESFYKLQGAEYQQLGLIKLLIDLTQDKRDHVAIDGLNALIMLKLRKEVSRLIPQLLQQDPSWIQVEEVSAYLHKRRQDLLTPFLKPGLYKNRFSSGNTAVLPAFHQGFFRWTAKQQQKYANSLSEIVNSSQRNAWELYQCINRLYAMPSAELTPLIKLADRDAKDIALRDKALEALGRADAGRGVDTLLQALDDQRARIAIYALRRSLLEMPAKNALALLSKAPRNKITVVKEILRLAGEFNGEDALHFLHSFAEEENLHPDAQIALLRAYWKHLNNEDVWTYFHAAAQSEYAALARSTIRIPQEGLTPTARDHLCQQITLLLQNEHGQVRRETLERLVYMPLGCTSEEMFAVLSGMLEDVDPVIGRLAGKAMLAAYVSQDPNKLVDAFSNINRPQSMAAIVDAFQNRNSVNHSARRNCAESLSLAILKRRKLPAQALRLALTLLPPAKILAILTAADSTGLLHPGAVETNVNSWHQPVDIYPQPAMADLEAKLRAAQSAGLRRLGLGLLIASSSRHGWTEDRREHLREYWADTDLWIAETAGLIELPQALDEHWGEIDH